MTTTQKSVEQGLAKAEALLRDARKTKDDIEPAIYSHLAKLAENNLVQLRLIYIISRDFVLYYYIEAYTRGHAGTRQIVNDRHTVVAIKGEKRAQEIWETTSSRLHVKSVDYTIREIQNISPFENGVRYRVIWFNRDLPNKEVELVF